MINGFALHQIICDESGKPVDYKFVEVNAIFEKMTGLKRDNIIGRLVTEVLPGTENDPVHWIEKYGEVALLGKSLEFENYSEALNKWFHIAAYCPETGFFITIFDDITTRKHAEEELKEKNAEQEKLLSSMVGRELKMVEMKEELKKMKEE